MKPETRLSLVAIVLILSAIFAFVVAKYREIAVGFVLWYVPVVLTILVVIHLGKKNYDRNH